MRDVKKVEVTREKPDFEVLSVEGCMSSMKAVQ
jgi:hypothetical protein